MKWSVGDKIKIKKVKKELIAQKLDLVIQKLINLDNPENEDKLKEGGEAVGFFQRDFGITEWDWPERYYGRASLT